MSDKKLINMVHDEMVTAIEKNMEQDMEELFGLSTMVPEQNKNLTIEELMKAAVLPAAVVAWRDDRQACLLQDMKDGRGKLVLNPEAGNLAMLDGDVTERYGVEYRIMVDDAMKGMRSGEGAVVPGYWIDPMPPFKPLDLHVPITVEPELYDKWDDFALRARTMSYPPLPMQPIMGLGVDVVDLGPTPMDLVAAGLPKATIREQRRALVFCWKASRLGISLKAYARQSKWGRAWLERKRR